MQILFVHPNYPAQFGHIASRLAERHDMDAVFVTRAADGARDGVRCIRYSDMDFRPRYARGEMDWTAGNHSRLGRQDHRDSGDRLQEPK